MDKKLNKEAKRTRVRPFHFTKLSVWVIPIAIGSDAIVDLEQKDKRSVATTADSSNEVGYIIKIT